MADPIDAGPAGAAPLGAELGAALGELARADVLLVACDYDGVIAPIVSDPARAFPLPASVEALTALAALPATPVAAVSGRARRDLAALSGFPAGIHLVGSHGTEFDAGFDASFDTELTPERRDLHARIAGELARIVDGAEGVALETKPASIAVHVRNAADDVGEQVLRAVADGPARWPGVEATAGKKVLELAVISTSKGTALDVLRERLGATNVLFVGDDVTDEKAFARLRDTDVGVKVGAGDTLARYRVGEPADVVTLLTSLLRRRARHLTGS
jgi:trehalose-phosphatase